MNLEKLELFAASTEKLLVDEPWKGRVAERDLHRMLRSAPDWMLYEVSEDCSSEAGPEHCWRCLAWDIYEKRQLAGSG